MPFEELIGFIRLDFAEISIQRWMLTREVMSEIIANEPEFFFRISHAVQKLINENQVQDYARAYDLFSIEGILRIIDYKKETASEKEKQTLREILHECMFVNKPLHRYLSNFLLQAPPWLIESFFTHLHGFIADKTFTLEEWRNAFMSMITCADPASAFSGSGLLKEAAIHNRTSIFTGLKTFGIDLNTAMVNKRVVLNAETQQREEKAERGFSAIHALAGNTSIPTATFLLQQG